MQIVQDYKNWKKAKRAVSMIIRYFDSLPTFVGDGKVCSCRAYPCFYRDEVCITKQIKDIDFYEIICGDCFGFKMLVQLRKSQQQYETAKQKLLDNFRFCKQK